MKPRIPASLEPRRALLHPAWIASLALLVLNDHVLKGSGLLPGWLTGKLSDFAGLLMAPPLFAALLHVRTRRGLALATLTVGVGFTALELSATLTGFAASIYEGLGMTWRSWSDPTDLLALAVLPFAYALVVRVSTRTATRAPRRPLELGLGVVGVAASIATTQSPQQTVCDLHTVDCDQDGYSAPDDCDDYDAAVYPGNGCLSVGAEDVCADGLDQDNDGLVDCADPDCAFACADLAALCSSVGQFDLLHTASLEGSTLTGSSVTDGTCIGADAPEVIYEATAPSDGILTIGIPENHGVHVRSDCTRADTELACHVPDPLGATITQPVVTGQQLTIIVEADDPLLAGPFSVPISFAPYGCGDGSVSGSEQCDDGNVESGDGCSASCQSEPFSLCDAATPLALGSTNADFGPSSGATVATCAAGPATGRSVFVVTPASDGTLSILVSSADDAVITGSLGCEPPISTLTCSDDAAAGGIESIAFPATAGEPLFVVVERLSGEAGSFTITTNLVAQ